MPKMVLNRNHTIRALGRDVQFVKNVPVDVHPELVPLAAGAGAMMVDGSPAIAEVPENTYVAPEGDARQKTVFAAFEKLVLRKQRGDFTASGFPDLRVLNGMFEFRVDRKELEATWDAYQRSKDEE